MVISVFCDGAVSGNGREDSVGGWGFVATPDMTGKCFFKSGAVIGATNNQMELEAVHVGLKESYKWCKRRAKDLGSSTYAEHIKEAVVIAIHSDSAYVVNAFNSGWTRNWIKNGWENAEGHKVKNRDLWEKIIKEIENFKEVKFVKVSGHSGDVMNEFADTLATKVILEHKLQNK